MRRSSLSSAALKISSSVFFLGYSPFFPGTLASLAAAILYITLLRFYPAAHLISVLVITVSGLWISDKAERLLGNKDARQIVIDDFNGMLISLLYLPHRPAFWLTGFIVFRLIDIAKPYPIRKIEKLKGGLGIMLDDVIAGVFTSIILQLFLRISAQGF